MRLLELAGVAPIEVVRDGEFQSLGLLSQQHPSMLVCLHERAARRRCATNPSVSCVITDRDLAESVPERLGLAVAVEPREAFYDLHCYLGTATDFYGTDHPSKLSPAAMVEPGARVTERGARIRGGCRIEAGAVVMGNCTLAEGVTIRAGAVIGAEGFHPVPYRGGLVNTPHFGSVRLGRGVEVGANSVVCRSVWGEATEIGDSTVIGPLAYVAHGVRIGSRSRLAASARVAGSAVLGEEVFVGIGAIVSARVTVGSGACVSPGSVVVRDVPPGETVTGNFAVGHRRFLRIWRDQLRAGGEAPR